MATGDLSYPYDVKLTIQGESPKGFMLSVPQDGTKQVLLEESPPPNLLRDFDEFSEVFRNSNPRNDIPFVITDLSGGVGQLYYDEGDTTKYRWSTGMVTHVKGKIFLPPIKDTKSITSATFRPTKIYFFGNYNLTFCNDKLYRRSTASRTGNWELVWTADGSIWDLEYFNNELYIVGSFLSGTRFYVQSNIGAAATWSPTSYSHSTIPNLPTVNIKALKDTLYVRAGTGGSNEIYFSTTPKTNSFSGPIIVGTKGYSNNSLNIIAVNNLLFVVNNQAIYSIDATQEVREVVWQFKDSNNYSENFQWITVYNNELFFNINNDVFVYNPLSGELSNIGISTKDSFSVKKITGIASDNNFLYVWARVDVPGLLPTQIALFSGFKNSNNEWVFEVLLSENASSDNIYWGLSCGNAGIDGFSALFLTGYDVSFIPQIETMWIPQRWDYSSREHIEELPDFPKTLWTSITRANYPGLSKRHTYLEGNFLNTGIGKTVKIEYSTDNGASHNTLATYNLNDALTNYDNVYGKVFSLKITLDTNDFTSPVVLDIASHQKIRFRFIPQITLAIRVASDLTLRNGNRDNRKIWDVWNDLVALRTTDKDILYEDFWGNQFEVTVDLLQSSNVKHNHPNYPELEAILVLTRKDKGD